MNNKKGWFHTQITEKAKEYSIMAIQEDNYTNGMYTNELEKELGSILGLPFCVYVNSGTAALAMSFIASGASKHSQVAVPGIGWVATPQAAQVTGASIDILDVRADIPILKIGSYYKEYDYIVAVNYNGRQVDIEKLRRANKKSIIIEDSCKSLFSLSYGGETFSGSEGNYGCYSLGMISALPGIYGGIVTARNPREEEKLRTIKWHGTSYEKNKEIYKYRSFNFKASNVHAAMALGMLEDYEERIERLRVIYNMYEKGLEGLENSKLTEVAVDRGEIPLLIDIETKDRETMINHLKAQDIETCNYHESLAKCPDVNTTLATTNSNYFGEHVFHPPCGADQELSTIEKAIRLIREKG